MANTILSGSKSPMAQVSILALIVFLAIAGMWAYGRLDEKKVDKEIHVQAVENLKDRIDNGFESMRREIRAAWRGGIE